MNITALKFAWSEYKAAVKTAAKAEADAKADPTNTAKAKAFIRAAADAKRLHP